MEQAAREQVEILSGYLAQKLRLADILRSALELFRRQRDDARLRRARVLLADLAQDRFKLAVVGQFKRGKSSLMNAILGTGRLPTGILPLTSVITAVCYGDPERLVIQRDGWALPHEAPLSEFEAYVTEKGNPGNEKQVVCAEFRLPAELLRLGFWFIDTPGVASPVTANTRTTLDFLPEADAIIFVTGFEATMNENEMAFLRSVQRQVRRVFLVINKADLVSVVERDEVVQRVRERLQAERSETARRVFAMSARDALESKLADDGEKLAASGLPEFEVALTHFLTTGKAREFLVRTTERAIGLLTRERLESRLAEMTAARGTVARDDLESALAAIRGEQRAVLESLRGRAGTALPGLFQSEVQQHCEDLRRALIGLVDRTLSRSDPDGMPSGIETLRSCAQEICDQRFKQWLAARRDRIVDALIEIAADEMRRLERSVDRALHVSVEMLGISAPREPYRLSGAYDWFSWASPVRPDWDFRMLWELDLFPFRWVRRRVRTGLERSLGNALLAYQTQMQTGLSIAIQAWVDLLARKVEDAMETMLPPAGDPANTDEPSRKEGERILERLEDFLHSLNEETAVVARYPSAAARGGLPEQLVPACVVCERLVSGLFDFFSKKQYELAANETERRAHTVSGGFCPLHAWQYETLASPHGVCVAYAPLLKSVARHLRASAAAASSAATLLDNVDELAPGAKCPACQVAAEIEQTAVQKLKVKLAESGEGVSLCLPHLHAMLARQPELDVARRLVSESAEMLDRVAQQMELYALKHDAIRRDLATGQEWNAHMQALALLAGNRRLSAA